MVSGINCIDVSASLLTSRFSDVEPVPTAVKVMLANTISPLTPSVFHAIMLVIPAELFLLCVMTVESELLATPVTCTMAGLYVMFILPVP